MKKGHGTLLLNVLALAIVTGLIIYEKPKSQNKHTPLVEAKKAGTTALSGTSPVTMSTAKMPPLPRHLDNYYESQSSSVKPDLKQREEPNRNNTNLALKLEPLRPNSEKQEKLEKADVLSALKPKLTRQSLGSLSPMTAPVIERSTVKKAGLQPLSPKTAPVIERSTVKKAGLQLVSPKAASTASLPTVSKQKREPENRFLPSSTDISKGMAILREAEKGNALNFELYWPQGQRQSERLYGLLSACYGMQSALLDEQGNLYFPASKRGNLPSGFSPLLHQVGQAAAHAEAEKLNTLREKHALNETVASLRVHQRATHAALLSGLEKLADRPLSEFGSISARYEISKGELTITDIQMDKVPKSGRIVLGPSNCG